MSLTEYQVEAFRLLYKKHFGLEISPEDAYEKGMRLVQLMKIILKPKEPKDE